MKLNFDSRRDECIYYARQNAFQTEDGCQVFEFFAPDNPNVITIMVNKPYTEERMRIWRLNNPEKAAQIAKRAAERRKPRQPNLFDSGAA